MKERIKELAEQAGFMVDQSGSIMVCFTSTGDSEVKKFAELIVRECLFIIDDERKPNMVNRTELWKQIKQHFGVEE